MRENIDALFALKKAALVSKQPKPFIFNFYNISGHYVTTGSGYKGIVRLLNPLIHGLNEEPFLPKYVIIIPDDDILRYMPETSAFQIGSILHYAIMQFDLFIERRRQDLLSKRPGALLPDDSLPKIIWVRMLKRPLPLNKKVHYNNRGKFNSILEERLLDGKEKSHCIMSIEVPLEEFDMRGGLTSSGKRTFWCEVNQALKKLDAAEITLKPRKPQIKPSIQQPLVKSVVKEPDHTRNRRHTRKRSHSKDRGQSSSRQQNNKHNRSRSLSQHRANRNADRYYPDHRCQKDYHGSRRGDSHHKDRSDDHYRRCHPHFY